MRSAAAVAVRCARYSARRATPTVFAARRLCASSFDLFDALDDLKTTPVGPRGGTAAAERPRVANPADSFDLFDLVDDIGSTSTTRHPQQPASEPRAVSAAAAQPRGAQSPSNDAKANARIAAESDAEASTTAHRPLPDQFGSVGTDTPPVEVRLKCLRDALRTAATNAHGYSGLSTGALSHAADDLRRACAAAEPGVRRADRRPPPPLTETRAQAYLESSRDLDELRQRLRELRGDVDAPESARAAWVASAVLSSTRQYMLLPAAERSRVTIDDLSSPFAFLSAGLALLCKESPTEDVWEATFLAAAAMAVPAKFFDQLWFKYTGEDLNTHAAHPPSSQSPPGFSTIPGGGGGASTEATLAALHWAANARDVRRTLALFNRLTKRQTAVPLRAHAAVLRCVGGQRFDGGVRAHIVRTIRETVTPQELLQTSWDDLTAVLAALDVTSAIELLRHMSRGHTSNVPVDVWLTMLRRLCDDGLVAEAEGMVRFLRTCDMTVDQRSDSITSLFRLHCVARPNFAAALDLLQQHVLEAPAAARRLNSSPAESREAREVRLEPKVEWYNMLLLAADSADAANALWLEMAAEGLAPNAESYANLLQTEARFGSAATLEAHVPDFLPSQLDELIDMPADADATLARERALHSMGMPSPL